MAEKAKGYGHRGMIVWQNMDKLEVLVNEILNNHIPKNKFKLRDQLDRSCSSCVANFIEGYYSGSIKEYLRFLSYSKRSLAELQDWARRCFHKDYLTHTTYDTIDDLCIKTMFLLNRLINALKAKALNPHSPKPSRPFKP